MGRVPPGGAIIYAAHDEEADPSEWEAFGVAADDHYGDRFAEETSLVVIGGQTGDPRPLHPEDLAYFATLGGTTGLPQANPRASWTSETHWALPGKRKKYSVSDLLTKRDARLARRVIKEESGNPLESVRLFRKFNTATGKIWKGMTIIEMTFASGATIRVQGGEVNYRGGKIKGIGSWKGTGRTFKAALTRMGV
jgi:hypothetical protein